MRSTLLVLLVVAQVAPVAAGPDAADAELRRANALSRAGQLDAAYQLYLDIIATHPEHAAAGDAANLALDTDLRLQRYDDMVALAERLREDRAFVAHRPELAARLREIHFKSFRDHVGQGTPTSAQLVQWGDDCAGAAEPSDAHGDELLYNAVAFYDVARAGGRALAAARRFATDYPKSHLLPRVLARAARVEAGLGLFDDAARDLERMVALDPRARDAPDALEDAIRYRIGLGDLDLAAHDLATFAKLPHVGAAQLARATAGLAFAEH